MDLFSCRSTCRPCDPATDTVRLDAGAIEGAVPLDVPGGVALPAETREQAFPQQPQASREAEAEEREAEEQRRRRQEEELARQEREAQLRHEREALDRARRQQEEAARRELEAQRLRELEEEKSRQEERARQEKAQAAAEKEAQRRAEAARAEEDRKRRAAVSAFLKEHGFNGGVRGPKRSIVNSTYPLHRAAKLGNVQMVQWLLQEGADAGQTNSSGRTAVQVARKHNVKNSHAEVLEVLSAMAAPIGGA